MAERRAIGPRERNLLIALGVVAVVAIGFLFIGGGGGDSGTDDFQARLDRIRAAASPSPSPSATGKGPRLTTESFEGRDPFQPPVSEPVPGGTGTPGDSGAPGGDGSGNQQRHVRLLDVFTLDGERNATVDVDGVQYTVVEGDTFADNFRLLELTKRCGTFVYGDERFTLCLGQEVQK